MISWGNATPALPGKFTVMPTKNLTDLFCERVKPPERGRIEYFDASFGGLALRVTETGNKSFSVHYRLNGKLRRYTLGQFPALKPAQARREASAALELARSGTDPTAAKRARRYVPLPGSDTFRLLLEDYLTRYMKKTPRQAPTLKQSARSNVMYFPLGGSAPFQRSLGATSST
jgi:hypothetical protein